MRVARLVAYGDKPTWITTQVAGTLNVPNMNCVMYVGLEVHRSSREPDQMFLRHNPELVGESVVPDVLQVIPSHDEIVRNGILQCQDADLICVPPRT